MSQEMKDRVSRFNKKAKDLRWPENIVDFDHSNFCFSGLKPLHEIEDEIQSAFIWCWSIKDHLKLSLYEFNKKLEFKDFSSRFENEINKHIELTLCADIANTIKHNQLNSQPRSGKNIQLDISQLILINKDNTVKIQRLNNQYFITNKSNDSVELKASIVDCDKNIICDAFHCLDKSLESWSLIEHKFSGS